MFSRHVVLIIFQRQFDSCAGNIKYVSVIRITAKNKYCYEWNCPLIHKKRDIKLNIRCAFLQIRCVPCEN